MYKEVALSDGLPCPVRVLGLFELDAIGPDIPGPYRYSILTYSGQVYEAEYPLPERPPEKPALSEAEGPEGEPAPGTVEWKQQQEYDTYLCAVAHEETRAQAVEAWLNNVAAYVLARCLDEPDRARLVEPEDYQSVYAAALVPRLRMEDIETALRQTFRAEFGGMGVLEALWKLEPGEGKLNPVALWEAQLLNELGLVSEEEEAQYAHLPVMARARKVAAFKLADWLGSLEIERVRKEMK
jgi:hypothetical protein